ncbi:sensor histidine kinase [Cohnella lupini]|uniref:Two-component system sensor histidine kinase YesM n=1 Tax=Cohnella lupini TaxID=1294267 RepID=A0A3D9INR3_9BACL|nr:histidine kinase [Cohnella lupini]RED63278.1 two-component system sensor histidine kinase YesM [Cohnella lupini]
MNNFGIFAKVTSTLFILLTPILILYAISNRTSVGLLKDEIMKVKQNQIETFASQLDHTLFQLDTYQKMLYESTDVRNLAYPDLLGDVLQKYRTVRTVSEEINRLAGYGDWKAVIAVSYPKAGNVIKSNSSLNALPSRLPGGDMLWQYFEDPAGSYFMEVLSYPRSSGSQDDSDMRVIVKMDVAEIKSALSDFKTNGSGDPFLYQPGRAPIYNYSSDRKLIDELLAGFKPELPMDDGYFLSKAGHLSYQIHYEKVDSLGWYVVDYVPISQIMAPIERNRTMFYAISSMMLFMAMFLAFVVYRNVKIPFRKLMQSMNLIEKGIYSIRMKDRPKGEFRFLYDRFNSMASRIEALIEDVFKEQLRSKEATLKQLQSQINPHFLYNTLAYIKSMIELDEKEAAIAMTMNLSKYYRYTTKTGKKLATLEEELDMVSHYLEINCSLMDGFEYEVEVEPDMLLMRVPRLILQPIVENVILHGFKNQSGFGMIRIKGTMNGLHARLTVEDSGVGIEQSAMEAMNVRIRSANNEEIESGMQNVHQRMKLMYGDGSGLVLRESSLGGVSAELSWNCEE